MIMLLLDRIVTHRGGELMRLATWIKTKPTSEKTGLSGVVRLT